MKVNVLVVLLLFVHLQFGQNAELKVNFKKIFRIFSFKKPITANNSISTTTNNSTNVWLDTLSVSNVTDSFLNKTNDVDESKLTDLFSSEQEHTTSSANWPASLDSENQSTTQSDFKPTTTQTANCDTLIFDSKLSFASKENENEEETNKIPIESDDKPNEENEETLHSSFDSNDLNNLNWFSSKDEDKEQTNDWQMLTTTESNDVEQSKMKKKQKKELCFTDEAANRTKCYVQIPKAVHFEEAVQYCESQFKDGRLITIESTAEQAFLIENFIYFFWTAIKLKLSARESGEFGVRAIRPLYALRNEDDRERLRQIDYNYKLKVEGIDPFDLINSNDWQLLAYDENAEIPLGDSYEQHSYLVRGRFYCSEALLSFDSKGPIQIWQPKLCTSTAKSFVCEMPPNASKVETIDKTDSHSDLDAALSLLFTKTISNPTSTLQPSSDVVTSVSSLTEATTLKTVESNQKSLLINSKFHPMLDQSKKEKNQTVSNDSNSIKNRISITTFKSQMLLMKTIWNEMFPSATPYLLLFVLFAFAVCLSILIVIIFGQIIRILCSWKHKKQQFLTIHQFKAKPESNYESKFALQPLYATIGEEGLKRTPTLTSTTLMSNIYVSSPARTRKYSFDAYY